MVKLNLPFLSLKAAGTIARAITIRRRGHDHIAEKIPIPSDAKSPAQLSWRHMYQKAVALWHALSSSEKTEWESLARPHHMTGFAYFLSQALKPNPGLYLPLQGGIMQGDIDMAKHRILKLPSPTDLQEAASKTYVDSLITLPPYTQGARAYHDANQSIPNTTWTTLAFNQERYDTDTIHDLVTNNSRLTCKTAGKYVIIAHFTWGTGTPTRPQIRILLNGAIIIAHKLSASPGAGNPGYTTTTIYNLSVNDYVQVLVEHSSGSAWNVLSIAQYSPEFMMQRIG